MTKEKPRTYIKVWFTGKIEPIRCTGELSMKALQAHVDGDFQFLKSPCQNERMPKFTACVNEDGLNQKLPQNVIFPGLVGNVLLGELVPGEDGERFTGFELKDDHEMRMYVAYLR